MGGTPRACARSSWRKRATHMLTSEADAAASRQSSSKRLATALLFQPLEYEDGAAGAGAGAGGGGGGGGGASGPMMLVEYDGRQIEMPMNVLLQMMGGDVAALQALMDNGNADDDDDDSSDGDFGDDSDGDSDSGGSDASNGDEQPASAPVVEDEAIEEAAGSSDSDESFGDIRDDDDDDDMIGRGAAAATARAAGVCTTATFANDERCIYIAAPSGLHGRCAVALVAAAV